MMEVDSMAVEIVTRIGAMAFRLRGAARATLPWLELRPLALSGGEFFVAATEDGATTYLVVDHRREPGAEPVSVEFWEPLGVGEAPLGGLFAFCDPATAASSASEAHDLGELRCICESQTAVRMP